MDKTKSRMVGVRVNKDQENMLSKLQEKSKLTKSELLLKGLETLAEYSDLGQEKDNMQTALQRLEKEAVHHLASLKRVRRKEEAIKDFIREIREVDEIIDRHGCDPSMLIQVLLDVQKQNHWLSKPALTWISERLAVPMSRIMQIASFYTMFSLEPQGRQTVHVCTGTACHVRGANELLARTESVLNLKPGQTDPGMNFTLKTVNCLGCCALGPVMTVGGDYHSNPSVAELKKLVEDQQ
ncbi:MAG: NAD(P)H-dependent oxidoreductase subunit E [Syntrophobacteraceae bacterium]|nr:NAD(P)H-dependent oxidoreductase subunit E [Syntrophobacteraceae bacterium]